MQKNAKIKLNFKANGIIIKILLLFTLTLNFQNQVFGNEQAVRFIKLANTYREAKDYANAEMYLNRGEKLLSKTNQYWLGYYNESKANLYLDKYFDEKNQNTKNELKKLSLDYFKRAKGNYDQAIRMDYGSNDAVGKLIKVIESNIESLNNNKKSDELTTINFDNQKLKEVPSLPKGIKNFSASNNNLKQIPKELVNSPNLTYINLQGNKISLLPDYISEFKDLEYLDLSNNKIKELSDNMVNLDNLRILDLSNNKLRKVPLNLCNLKNLQVLNLKGNKLSFEAVKNLIMCLKNTNILIDKFEQSAETGEEIEEQD